MKTKKTSAFIFFLITIFFGLMFFTYYFTSLFFDKKFNDYFIRQTLKDEGSKGIVMVVIDDKSTNEIKWPWSRKLYSEIFDYLQNYADVKSIGFDAVISSYDEENPQSDIDFFNSLKGFDKLVSGFDLYPAKSNQVIPDKRLLSAFDTKFNGIKIVDKRKKKLGENYNSLVSMPTEYLKNIHHIGSVIIPLDRDGIIRNNLPVVEFNNKLYPSLGLKVYAITTGTKDFFLTDKYLCSFNDNCKSLKIPIQQDKKLASGIYSGIKWKKPYNEYYSHKVYSAIDVLNSYYNLKQGKKPQLNPSVFKDKIVLVGGNANIQSLEDRRNTPVLLKHAGVDLQATFIDNLINNDFNWQTTKLANLLILAVVMLISYLLIFNFSVIFSISLITIFLCALFFGYYILLQYGIITSFLPMFAVEIILMTLGYSYRFLIEGQKKDKLEKAMGLYISKDIMNKVVKNIDDIKLGGKRADVTVLFADIRGFTSISERLPAEDVTKILNEYFAVIEPVIKEYKGVINKFIGDAVMVIFGEPIHDKNHPINAVLCANKMLKKVKMLQEKWIKEGKPNLEIGIGINTGEAFVGNIGTEERLEYTVIGDTVNIASRIEYFNKVYKTRFLISQKTYNYVSTIADVIKIREVTIRGKVNKINIYEVLRIFNGEQNS